MNKFMKLMLTSAVLVTTGMATTIEGIENIAEGGSYEIKDNDCILTGAIILSGSENEDSVAKLTISPERTLDIQGGILSYDGTKTYPPKITLNGTIKLNKNDEDYPTLTLDSTVIESILTETYLKTQDGIYQIISEKNNGSIIEYETSGSSYMVYNGALFYSTSGEITGEGWSVIPDTDPVIEVFLGMYLRKNAQLYRISYNAYEVVTQKKGVIDLSLLREYTGDSMDVLDLSSNISVITPIALGNVKLPFNCSFSNIDLSRVDKVEYRKCIIGERSGPGIENSIIKRVILRGKDSYGDYQKAPLGVILPEDTSKIIVTETTIDGTQEDINFSELVGSDGYNKSGLKLQTNDLTRTTHEIVVDTTYNFGFIGTKAISITGEDRAIFKGNNSEYTPEDNNLIMPAEVEFAANSSLFPITQTYLRGIFTEGELSNEVPAGKIITFSNGISLGTSHTLTVKGSLVI